MIGVIKYKGQLVGACLGLVISVAVYWLWPPALAAAVTFAAVNFACFVVGQTLG